MQTVPSMPSLLVCSTERLIYCLAFLTCSEPPKNLHRFYVVQLAPTLYGDWALLCEWGRSGSLGTLRLTSFDNHARRESRTSDHQAPTEPRLHRARNRHRKIVTPAAALFSYPSHFALTFIIGYTAVACLACHGVITQLTG